MNILKNGSWSMLLMREKHFWPPLILNCYVLCTLAILKNIRKPLTFSSKKWLLTHAFWRVPSSKKSSCKQACIGFMTILTLVSSYVVNNKPPASAGGDFLYSHDFYSIVVPASPVRLHSALSREVMIALRPFPASKKLT